MGILNTPVITGGVVNRLGTTGLRAIFQPYSFQMIRVDSVPAIVPVIRFYNGLKRMNAYGTWTVLPLRWNSSLYLIGI